MSLTSMSLAVGAGWSLVTYAACFVFDMFIKVRLESAYIAPHGRTSTVPTLWSGLSARHVLLVPLAIALQAYVRSPDDSEHLAVGVGVALGAAYFALLLRDIFRIAKRKDNPYQ